MGHLLNPISNKLGHSFFWKNLWCLYTSYNYGLFVLIDIQIYYHAIINN